MTIHTTGIRKLISHSRKHITSETAENLTTTNIRYNIEVMTMPNMKNAELLNNVKFEHDLT